MLKAKKAKKILKKINDGLYLPQVFSQQPSHSILRKKLKRLPIPSVIRLGSTTNPKYDHYIEINSVQSIKISSDKKLMKEKFNEAGVKTADWTYGTTIKEIVDNLAKLGIDLNKEGCRVIAKSRNGSRGKGNYQIKSLEDLKNWEKTAKQFGNLDRYIFERYMNYALEYRLHITKHGCFYTCRKALKKGVDTDKVFQRHAGDDVVWYLEDNVQEFKKPNSWNDIVAECVKALNTIGADVLSFDIKVQSAIDPKTGKPRKYQNFFLIETNSASSMKAKNPGEVSICAEKYLDMLPKLIMEKGEAKKK